VPTAALLAHFTGVDSTPLASYAPDAGPAFVQQSGAAMILSGRALFTSSGIATQDAGRADGVLSATIGVPANSATCSLVFRFQNATNYIRATLVQTTRVFAVAKVVGGSLTTLGSITLTALPAGDHTLAVTLSANQIVASVDGGTTEGTDQQTVADSFNVAETKYGLQATSSLVTFDDFQFLVTTAADGRGLNRGLNRGLGRR
jgi:hypothetical protein